MSVPNLPENALALALAAADTKLEKTSPSAGASDVSYRLGTLIYRPGHDFLAGRRVYIYKLPLTNPTFSATL